MPAMRDSIYGVPRVIRRGDWRTMLWKNGRGVTHELVCLGDGAGGFGLRMSIAEVSSDGPFSRFEGVDRVITPIAGKGFRLRRADGFTVTLERVGEPFAFAGEDDWACTLLDGPTMDFNVMTDRARWTASVAHRAIGVIDAPYVLALARGTFGGVALDAFDLVVTAEPGEATAPVLAVTAAPRSVTR